MPWLSVKLWELNNEFILQDHTASLYPYGEVRGWPGIRRHVFDMAAHRSSANNINFDFQTEALSAYHAASWYHMQMILNSGMRAGKTNNPQDWFYTPAWLNRATVLNNRPLAALALLSQIKMYQNLDTTGHDGKGTIRLAEEWWIAHVIPIRFDSESDGAVKNPESPGGIDTLGSPWKYLAQYQPSLQGKVTKALLRAYLQKQKIFAIADLPRARNSNNADGRDNYGTVEIVPRAFDKTGDTCFYSCLGGGVSVADSYYRGIPRFIATEADHAVVNELIDWCKQVWPKGNWDVLRP